MTKEHIDPNTRGQIAVFLPSAILKTLNSYDDFTANKEPVSSKDFAAHHSACKAALAHLELLLKLAQWAEIPEDSNKENEFLSGLLKMAEDRVRQHDGINP
ncbi:MAG TPA: hypothetical protein PLF01_03455 [Alphaproteobacteria bacterium]|nr:hypothetical protein [Alphaproteobacteria bacterium]